MSSVVTDDEFLLLRFDFDPTYGPRCGITRLERYNRANKLNLAPPVVILEAIRRTPTKMYNNEAQLVKK